MAGKKRSIESINAKLKALSSKLKVVQRGDTLSLRGTLPPKPSSKKHRPYQQYVALGVDANPAGLEYAEAKALEVVGLLGQKRFSWDELDRVDEGELCGAVIERFKNDWWAQQSDKSEKVTALRWRDQFESPAFRRLPPDEKLSEPLLRKTVERWKPDSASRRVACLLFTRLAKFAGMTIDLSDLRGGYGPGSVKRFIPSDNAIIAAIDGITNRRWQWIAGMMATYNLRDHEAFMCDLEWREYEGERYLAAIVHEDTKTGAREVLPLPAEWVERWKLYDVRKPKVTALQPKDYGVRTADYFKRKCVGFRPYDLRHAWDLRAVIELNIPTLVAARMMGHSPKMNAEIYQKHVDESRVKQAYFSALKKNREI